VVAAAIPPIAVSAANKASVFFIRSSLAERRISHKIAIGS
jgi:hypothetical protein